MEGVPQLESKMRREARMGRASGMQLHAGLARKDLHLGLLKCDFSMEIVGIVQHLYTHLQFYLFFFFHPHPGQKSTFSLTTVA